VRSLLVALAIILLQGCARDAQRRVVDMTVHLTTARATDLVLGTVQLCWNGACGTGEVPDVSVPFAITGLPFTTSCDLVDDGVGRGAEVSLYANVTCEASVMWSVEITDANRRLVFYENLTGQDCTGIIGSG
jgi:hypothetical protein